MFRKRGAGIAEPLEQSHRGRLEESAFASAADQTGPSPRVDHVVELLQAFGVPRLGLDRRRLRPTMSSRVW